MNIRIQGVKYIPRLQSTQIRELFSTFPVVVVTGARQVGKSTLLTQLFPDLPHITFDPVIDVENAKSDPELFLANRPAPLFLDEIQYVPELVPAIKRTVDRDRKPAQYLITGSQQWNVMKLLAESLAGRAVFVDLEGLSILEIAQKKIGEGWLVGWLRQEEKIAPSLRTLPLAFPLYESIWRGFLPEAQFLPRKQITPFLNAYQRTYIERDVRLLADVSDLQLFSRFFRLCGALTAQEINSSEMGRELGLTPQTATRWLDILRATFQWFEVPPYAGNTIKRISSKPKGYLSDTGLAANAQAISSPEAIAAHPLWGALFETLVVNEIRKQCRFLETMPNLYHWRSHGGAEVDLIIELDGRFFPMEIKAKSRPTKRDGSGIQAFRETYRSIAIATGLIIAPSETCYPVAEDLRVMPWNSAER